MIVVIFALQNYGYFLKLFFAQKIPMFFSTDIDKRYNIWYNASDKTCYNQHGIHLQARLQVNQGRLLRERCGKRSKGASLIPQRSARVEYINGGILCKS